MTRRIMAILVALTFMAAGPASFAHAAAPASAALASAADRECGDAVAVANAERCAPEAPLPIGMPVAGLTVFGAYVWLMRRRPAGQSQAVTSSAE